MSIRVKHLEGSVASNSVLITGTTVKTGGGFEPEWQPIEDVMPKPEYFELSVSTTLTASFLEEYKDIILLGSANKTVTLPSVSSLDQTYLSPFGSSFVYRFVNNGTTNAIIETDGTDNIRFLGVNNTQFTLPAGSILELKPFTNNLFLVV